MLEPVLSELRADGHLRGESLPPLSFEAGGSHWILALQVIGGWLAAVFMLLFLGMGAAPLVKGASNWIVIGLITTALTGLLMGRVVDTGSTVLRQFLLVASLAGHGALIVGATMFGRSEGSTSFFMIALYETVMLLWVAWMPHRLVAALVGSAALVMAVDMSVSWELVRYWVGIYWFAVCLLWYHETRWQAHGFGESVYALACALTLLCFAYALSGYFSHNLFGLHKTFHFDAVLCSAVNIAFVLIIARPQLKSIRNLFAAVLLAIALGMTWQAPAVGMGALTLVFGFARGHRWLMWLGGAMLVFGVGRFYYDLQLILLHKASLMFLGGILLLAVRALICRQEKRA